MRFRGLRVGRGKRVVQRHVEDHRDDEHRHVERAAGHHRHRAGLAPARRRGHRRAALAAVVARKPGYGDALRRIAPDAPKTALASFSQLIMTLVAATVRHAIAQDARAAGRILTLFKRMLPNNLAALEMLRNKTCSGNTAAGSLRLVLCRAGKR